MALSIAWRHAGTFHGKVGVDGWRRFRACGNVSRCMQADSATVLPQAHVLEVTNRLISPILRQTVLSGFFTMGVRRCGRARNPHEKRHTNKGERSPDDRWVCILLCLFRPSECFFAVFWPLLRSASPAIRKDQARTDTLDESTRNVHKKSAWFQFGLMATEKRTAMLKSNWRKHHEIL